MDPSSLQPVVQEANSHLNLPTTRVLAPKRAAELEFAAADPSRSISASRKLAQDDLTSTSDNASADSPASTSSSAQETPFDPIRFKPQYQLADADPDFAEQLRVSYFHSLSSLSSLKPCLTAGCEYSPCSVSRYLLQIFSVPHRCRCVPEESQVRVMPVFLTTVPHGCRPK